ncbi:PH domain-containing protein [Marinobacter salicampi]|uniref:PH domain-containing protein n=1 Tax=Marinobacter salicampi TaxID=435907 RepID=UPI00140CFD9B|nr:PH domain-containing protein [Marinobacter salicampi]
MQYETGLPIRGLLPVLIEKLKDFRDGWWLKIILVAAVLGVAPVLKSNAILALSIIGISIAAYTFVLWRTYRYSRNEDDIHIQSGLAEKLRVHYHTSQISRLELERDYWCLMLGLVTISIYTEGSDTPSAKAQYITREIALKLAGDLLPEEETKDDQDLFYRMTFLDAIKGAILVPIKQLLLPALVIFALAMPLLDSSTERPDEKLLKEGAMENASSLLTTKIHPGVISTITFMSISLVVMLSTASRVLYALPYFLRTEVRITDGVVFVRSGIFNLRQWRLRISDIASIETRHGIFTRLLGGSAALLQTRSADLTPGMHGNYLAFLPEAKIQELYRAIGIQPVTMADRRLNMRNFIMDSLRVVIEASPIVLAVVLFLPASFWNGHDLVYYSAEAVVLFLVYTLWRWRKHWNSGFAMTAGNVEVAQRRWTNNHSSARAADLHGMTTYSLPWCGNSLIALKPGLPGLDQRVTATSPWDAESCFGITKQAALKTS